MTKIISYIVLFSCLGLSQLQANYIVVSDGSRLADPNRDMITFSVSWQNSWWVAGAPSNHDAAWVFVKLRPCDGGSWAHGLLDTTSGAHAYGASLEEARPIKVADRFGNIPAGATPSNHGGHNTGVLLKRNAFGQGHIVNSVCTLKLVNSLIEFDPAIEYNIKVIGIEMVQVVAEGFAIGDGTTDNNQFTTAIYDFNNDGDLTDAVDTTNSISFGTVQYSSSKLDTFAMQVQEADATIHSLPAKYPKGYGEFYCMKYEISQGMFIDFMKTTSGYSGSPVNGYGNSRNNLSSDLVSTTPDRAQNYMNWADLLAYCDWAALRPMTEMEYEKACRGPMGSNADEKAWGNSVLRPIVAVNGTEDGTEWALPYRANCNFREIMQWRDNGTDPPGSVWLSAFDYNVAQCRPSNGAYIKCTGWSFNGTYLTNRYTTSIWSAQQCNYYGDGLTLPMYICGSNTSQGFGPVGCGIFARDTTQSRTETGAGYYGAMELSGNVHEQCVGIYHTTYEGIWGDGDGIVSATDWPTGLTCALRGGSYGHDEFRLEVSDRNRAVFTASSSTDRNGPNTDTYRKGTNGGRGVR